MFGIRQKRLARLLHELGSMLEAGVTLRRTLDVLTRGAKDYTLRRVLERVAGDIEAGLPLTEALERRRGYFPSLVIELIHVAEMSGNLDQVCTQLGRYYDEQVRIRGRMMRRLAYPVFQIIAVIAVIYLLRYIASAMALATLGPALRAGQVVLRVLQGALAAAVLYFILKKTLGGMRLLDEFVLRVPLVGRVVRTLAIARFSWAMQLMYEAGAPVSETIMRAMSATNNAAFRARGQRILDVIQGGGTIRQGLERTGLFPLDYLEMVSVGEESGRLPESLGRVARHKFEQAETGMAALTTAITWLVYVGMAAMIIYMIVTLFKGYVGAASSLLDGAL